MLLVGRVLGRLICMYWIGKVSVLTTRRFRVAYREISKMWPNSPGYSGLKILIFGQSPLLETAKIL